MGQRIRRGIEPWQRKSRAITLFSKPWTRVRFPPPPPRRGHSSFSGSAPRIPPRCEEGECPLRDVRGRLSMSFVAPFGRTSLLKASAPLRVAAARWRFPPRPPISGVARPVRLNPVSDMPSRELDSGLPCGPKTKPTLNSAFERNDADGAVARDNRPGCDARIQGKGARSSRRAARASFASSDHSFVRVSAAAARRCASIQPIPAPIRRCRSTNARTSSSVAETAAGSSRRSRSTSTRLARLPHASSPTMNG